MKRFFALMGLLLCLTLAGPAQAAEPPSGADFLGIEQQAFQLLSHTDSAQELDALNQHLLQLYLWSKDNFEPRQWPALAADLARWPALFQQRAKLLHGNNALRLQSIEAAYWLLLHDYTRARQISHKLPELSIGPYPAMLTALLGEQEPDNPGIWRIPLEQVRVLVRRYPQQPLAYLMLAESILERIQDPGSEPDLIREAQWAVSQVLDADSQSLFARYQQGQLLFLRQRQAEARSYFEKQVSSQGPLAAEAVGNFYGWMQRPALALAFYEIARLQLPRELRLYQKMEPLYLQTQPEAAVQLYLKGLAAAPDQNGLYTRLQTLYGQVGLERLKLWLQKYLPEGSYMTRLILGDLALREGDLRSAEHWYNKALDQQPKRIEAYLNLLGLFWDQRDISHMNQVLASARTQGLKNRDLDYWQGTAALQEGKPDLAIALLEPLASQDSRALFTLAIAYRQKHRFDKARELINALIQQDPQNVMLVVTLGDIYREARSYQQAEQVYLLAQRMDPYNSTVFFSLGNLYSEQKRYAEAVTVMQRAILIAPNNLEYRNNLGNVFLRQRQLEAAVQEFEAIIAKQPDFAQAYYNLACAYAILGRNGLAIEHLRQALQLEPALRQTAQQDHDLEGLREDSRFQELMR